MSPEPPCKCMKSVSAELKPDTLFRTVDMMVRPMVPPSGTARAMRAMIVARWFLKRPTPCSGAAMNFKPMPAPTMAMKPKMEGECWRYMDRAIMPVPVISSRVPRKTGGQVIRSHRLQSNEQRMTPAWVD